MSLYLKKILAPFIYALFMIPAAAGAFAFLVFFNNAGFVFGDNGRTEGILGIIIFGTLAFILGSSKTYEFEKISKLSILTHLRQSSLMYAGLIVCGIFLRTHENASGSVYYALLMGVALLFTYAVIINAAYLVYKKNSFQKLSRFWRPRI